MATSPRKGAREPREKQEYLLRKVAETRAMTVEEKLAAAESEVHALRQEVEVAQREKADLQAQLQQLEGAAPSDKTDSRIAELELQLEKTKHHLEDVGQDVLIAHEELRLKREELSASKQRNQQDESTIFALRQSEKKHQEQVLDLQAQVALLREQKRTLEDRNRSQGFSVDSGSRDSVEKLQATVAALEGRLTRSLAEIEEKNRQLSAEKAESQRLREELRQTSQTLATRVTEYAVMRDKIQELEQPAQSVPAEIVPWEKSVIPVELPSPLSSPVSSSVPSAPTTAAAARSSQVQQPEFSSAPRSVTLPVPKASAALAPQAVGQTNTGRVLPAPAPAPAPAAPAPAPASTTAPAFSQTTTLAPSTPGSTVTRVPPATPPAQTHRVVSYSQGTPGNTVTTSTTGPATPGVPSVLPSVQQAVQYPMMMPGQFFPQPSFSGLYTPYPSVNRLPSYGGGGFLRY